jgi:hypothetical protein
MQWWKSQLLAEKLSTRCECPCWDAKVALVPARRFGVWNKKTPQLISGHIAHVDEAVDRIEVNPSAAIQKTQWKKCHI